jgi:hypothetical protein
MMLPEDWINLFDWENVYADVSSFQSRLSNNGSAEVAKAVRAADPSEQEVLGTPRPFIRRIVREWLALHRDFPAEYILTVASLLWSDVVRENRLAAIALIHRHEASRDLIEFKFWEKWARETDSTEVADYLAGMMGRLLEINPRLHAAVRGWMNSSIAIERRLAVTTLSVASRDQNWEPGLAQMVERLEGDDDPVVSSAVSAAKEKLSKAKARRG